MTTTVSPALRPVPAGMVTLRDAASRMGRAVWQALMAAGERRAARELAQFAATHADRYPELARFARPAMSAGQLSSPGA